MLFEISLNLADCTLEAIRDHFTSWSSWRKCKSETLLKTSFNSNECMFDSLCNIILAIRNITGYLINGWDDSGSNLISWWKCWQFASKFDGISRREKKCDNDWVFHFFELFVFVLVFLFYKWFACLNSISVWIILTNINQ